MIKYCIYILYKITSCERKTYMAKRHVVEYFLQVEYQYLEMLDNLKEFKELLAANRISNEEFQQAIAEIELIKANYERISYIMFLLNKPNRKTKEEVELAKSWYDALQYASKEAIINENNDALAKIKDMIKKGELNYDKSCN